MRHILGLTLTLSLFFSSFARPEEGREFFTSVIYGTVAGTLVGVATLAFTPTWG